ncbi:MAG TPA: MOSC N-terminal beta barrel domain-containing protein, partial [Actinomycetota bacterium]|nr:MOSC N-terminal beta barrel domain-containing protein [Actinomycetota bacterium]
MSSNPIRVVSLRRFPVKSLLGEVRDHLDLDERGCVGDRAWSVRTAEGKIGSGKNTRRFAAVPGLLELRASERDGRVVVTFPDGTAEPVDSPGIAGRLTRHLGRPVTVARETDVSHFDDGPISLAGTASIEALAQ